MDLNCTNTNRTVDKILNCTIYVGSQSQLDSIEVDYGDGSTEIVTAQGFFLDSLNNN